MVQKKSVRFLQEFIAPYVQSFATMDETDPLYREHLDIFTHLCVLKNPLVLNYLIALLIRPPMQ